MKGVYYVWPANRGYWVCTLRLKESFEGERNENIGTAFKVREDTEDTSIKSMKLKMRLKFGVDDFEHDENESKRLQELRK